MFYKPDEVAIFVESDQLILMQAYPLVEHLTMKEQTLLIGGQVFAELKSAFPHQYEGGLVDGAFVIKHVNKKD